MKIASPALGRGSRGGFVAHNAGKPDEVFNLLEWNDHDGSRDCVQSSDWKEERERAGVGADPDFYCLEELAPPAM